MDHNRTTTQYFAYGKQADGSWKAIPPMCYDKEKAEAVIADYKRYAAMHPKDYFHYTEYKIRKRTVVTTYGEWEDV